jgi:hypothetical protein
MDLAWGTWQKVTLQRAVSEGVRYAITSQVMSGMGLIDSIKTQVQQHASGQLGNTQAGNWNTIHVDFYDSSGNLLAVSAGNTSTNLSGDLIKVSIQQFQGAVIAPIALAGIKSILGATTINVAAWDTMESVSQVNGAYPLT